MTTKEKDCFVAADGDLCTNDRHCDVIREKYSYHFEEITDTHRMRSTLRAGPYAWPGGYPLFFTTTDGASICFKCARSEYRLISDSIRNNFNDGWQVSFCTVNYENNDLFCDHCGEKIESAYGEDDED
ncbi:hypothetical protein [Endozoicomonas sp. ALC066]|uniref:hypothetical protein n=1 Tax=Endozoicomonas sp. ALC066 TaxID=3403078 RepID=UPI003BB5EA6B